MKIFVKPALTVMYLYLIAYQSFTQNTTPESYTDSLGQNWVKQNDIPYSLNDILISKENFKKVLKLNIASVIISGISLDLENRVAVDKSIIATGGVYPGLFGRSRCRFGLDFRQYLGKGTMPNGVFASIGIIGDFYEKSSNSIRILDNLITIRTLFGYQVLSDHFTFEGGLGPGLGIIIFNPTNSSKSETTLSIIPSAKLSIGYAF